MKTIATFLVLALTASAANAGSIRHHAGGRANIRDFFVSAPGAYGILSNYDYQTGRLSDANGQQKGSVNINPCPGPERTLHIKPDVDVYVMAPVFAWVTPYEVASAKVAFMIVPVFANTSVGASVDIKSGRGTDADTSQFGLGDWHFQPLWLGWTLEHWDFALGWGFYAPTGKYNTDVETFPVVGDVRIADDDNIGLGFWTNRLQGSVAWYPWANKPTAITLATNYEIHSEKEDYHLTPGQNLSLNWSISQYLPLAKDQKWLVEIGTAGYDTWQVTKDSGKNASNALLDQTHAAGGQIGITSFEYEAALNFHAFREFEPQDRFEANVFGLHRLEEVPGHHGGPDWGLCFFVVVLLPR